MQPLAFVARHPLLQGLCSRLSPVRVALIGSLVLSLIAILGAGIVGRDGAFYLDIARQVGIHGPKVALQLFDWPWFPMLLAGSHGLSGLSLEVCAYLWSAMFAAVTSTLLVDCVRQRWPHASWWACLVVLAMPAFNQFRWDIIRESGFWCFCTLALWLALRWQQRGGWWLAAAVHVAIALAVLFRLEAVVLLLALSLWQLPNAFRAGQRRRLAQFLWLPVLLAIPALVLVLPHLDPHTGRLAYLLQLVQPESVFASFNRVSEQFGASLVNKYSIDETGRIIFFGMLAATLIKFVSLMGPFAAPFLLPRQWQAWRSYVQAFQPLAWTALCYLGVLMLFFVNAQFMNGRYLSFLDLLVVPLLATALWQFALAFPRLGKLIAAAGLLVMLGNVVSTGAPKTHFIAAGHWLAEHVDDQAAVYYEDGRISWYAGRGYPPPTLARETVMSPAEAGHYRYFVFEAAPDEAWLQGWIHERGLQVLAQFANRKGKTVTVVGP